MCGGCWVGWVSWWVSFFGRMGELDLGWIFEVFGVLEGCLLGSWGWWVAFVESQDGEWLVWGDMREGRGVWEVDKRRETKALCLSDVTIVVSEMTKKSRLW